MTNSRQMQILLVEDNDRNASMIRAMLDRRMATTFDVTRVTTRNDALKNIESNTYDVILLDLTLPDSSGLDTFHAIHGATKRPIVVISGVGDEQTALDAVSLGADDYLVKGELTAGWLVRAVTFAIERYQHRNVEKQLAQKEMELAAAHDIQKKLIPARNLEIPGLDVAGRLIPAEEASGDYFDFLEFGDGKIGLMVADVAGHGLGPSQLMMEVRSAARAFAMANVAPSNLLSMLSRLFFADGLATGHFVTAFLAYLDPSQGTFSFCGAGHEGYWIEPDGDIVHLASTGTPIGLLKDGPVKPGPTIAFKQGGLLLITSDGAHEAMNNDQVLMGKPALNEIVFANRSAPASQIVDLLHDAVKSHCDGAPQTDDVTIVVAKAESLTSSA